MRIDRGKMGLREGSGPSGSGDAPRGIPLLALELYTKFFPALEYLLLLSLELTVLIEECRVGGVLGISQTLLEGL